MLLNLALATAAMCIGIAIATYATLRWLHERALDDISYQRAVARLCTRHAHTRGQEQARDRIAVRIRDKLEAPRRFDVPPPDPAAWRGSGMVGRPVGRSR